MINVAIVEDEDCAANNLSEYLNTFGRQNNTEIKAERFRDAISLLTGYSGKFDIVFMDIELPEMKGRDLISGQDVSGAVRLNPWECAWVKLNR